MSYNPLIVTVIHKENKPTQNFVNTCFFFVILENACDFVEFTKRIDLVEPLLEFTLLRRNPRHDEEIAQLVSILLRPMINNLPTVTDI